MQHDSSLNYSAAADKCPVYSYWRTAAGLKINRLKLSGHCMYRQFNIQQFYVLPTQCIYVFCVDLRTNSDYFPIQH